jgi:hypothetical protein
MSYLIMLYELQERGSQMRLRSNGGVCVNEGKMRVVRSFIVPVVVMRGNNYGILLKRLVGTRRNFLGQSVLELKSIRYFLNTNQNCSC